MGWQVWFIPHVGGRVWVGGNFNLGKGQCPRDCFVYWFQYIYYYIYLVCRGGYYSRGFELVYVGPRWLVLIVFYGVGGLTLDFFVGLFLFGPTSLILLKILLILLVVLCRVDCGSHLICFFERAHVGVK